MFVPRPLVLRVGTGTSLLAETIAAVNRAIAPGPERNHRFRTALGASDGMHFAGAVKAASGPFGPS